MTFNYLRLFSPKFIFNIGLTDRGGYNANRTLIVNMNTHVSPGSNLRAPNGVVYDAQIAPSQTTNRGLDLPSETGNHIHE